MDTKKKISIIITIIIGIAIIAADIYIVYNVFILPDTKVLSPKEEEKPLSFNEKKDLLNYVPLLKNSLMGKNAYQEGKMTFSDINPIIILNKAYEKIITDDKNLITFNLNEYNEFKLNHCQDETSVKCFAFYRDSLLEVIKSIYGDVKIFPTEFNIGNSETDKCTLLNDYLYMCSESINSVPASERKAGAITLIKEDENGIYIYEKTLFLVGINITVNENAYATNIASIYKYANENEKIDSEVNFTIQKPEYDEYLIDRYGNMSLLYKHTFKKDTNGNYIWIESEPLSEPD